jgi:hypothetical protein
MPDPQKKQSTDEELTRVLLLRELRDIEQRGRQLQAADARESGDMYLNYSNDIREGRDVEAGQARRSRPGYRPGGKQPMDINLPVERKKKKG